MYVFISILIVIAALLLILLVLVQESKGGGLASGFSSSNQVMGVRKTTDFLEKATWTLISAVAVLCIVATFFIADAKQSAQDSALKGSIEKAEKAAAPAVAVPNMGGTSVPTGSEAAPAPNTGGTAPAQTPAQPAR